MAYSVDMFKSCVSWGDAVDEINRLNKVDFICVGNDCDNNLVKFKSSNGKSMKIFGITNSMKLGSFKCSCCRDSKNIFDDMGGNIHHSDYFGDVRDTNEKIFYLLSDKKMEGKSYEQSYGMLYYFFSEYLYGKKGGIEESIAILGRSNEWRDEDAEEFLEYCKEIRVLNQERESKQYNDGLLVCNDCITNDKQFTNKIHTDYYLSYNINCCGCDSYIGSMLDYNLNGHSIKSKLYCETCKSDNTYGTPLVNSPKLRGQCNNCFADNTYTKNCFECIDILDLTCENKDCLSGEIAKRSGWNKILIRDDFDGESHNYNKINDFLGGGGGREHLHLDGKDYCESCYIYHLNKLNIHKCVGDCRGNEYCGDFVDISHIDRYSRLMYNDVGASDIVIKNRLHYPYLFDETLKRIRTEDIRDKSILRSMSYELNDLLCLRNLDRIPYDINENNTINAWSDTFIELPILCDDNDCFNCFYQCEECDTEMSYQYLYEHYIKPYYYNELTEEEVYASIVGLCCKFSKSCVICKSVDSDIGFCDSCMNKPKDLKDKAIFDRLKLNITKLNSFKSKRLKCGEDIEHSDCAICMGEVKGCLLERKCKHTFHLCCDYQWSESSELCAYCRGEP